MLRKLWIVTMIGLLVLVTPAPAWTGSASNAPVDLPLLLDEPPEDPEGETRKQADQPFSPTLASTSPITHTIYLKSRQFQPSSVDLPALQKLSQADRERRHVLVQLDFIPRQAAKDELAKRGMKLLSYVPDYAWIASVPAADIAGVSSYPGVTWVGELEVGDKLDPAIVQDQWGTYNLSPDGVAAVYVVFHPDEDLEVGRTLVETYGGRVTGELPSIHLLTVEMPRNNIQALAAEEVVQWIEPAEPPLDEGNDGIRPQIGVDVVQSAPYNLDGSGIDVLVYDGGQAGAHLDFGTRLTIGAGDGSGVSEHATHVAGTVGGSGANSAAEGGTALQWRGMATNADLISYGYEWDSTGFLFYNNPGDIEADWAAAQNTYGADLGTASLTSNVYMNYTSDCWLMGNYGTTSVLVDQMARGGNATVGLGDKYISTWCNGNERNSAGSCSDTYNSISPPAAAKNPIHVGASNTNNNTIASFSSWGPTDDGRIKPSVVAGGCQTTGDGGITSTDNFPLNSYTTMCGCSMATPAVAGSIALMLQHYRDVYNTSGNFWPSTAKGILMHTATDMGNPGPDYQWGYGQVNIQAAVDLISRKAFRQDNVAQGEVDTYSLIVPNNTSPARVTLVWDDFEATFNANPALINNLNLELVSPSGTVWRPWVLDPANPANDATRGVDNLNNQEQVEVPTPEVGTWLVRVRGTTVPQGPQDYSLICEGCKPLNLGVCQTTIDGTGMASALPLGDAPLFNSEGDEVDWLPDPLAQPLTLGEAWQRSLEAGQAASMPASEGESITGLEALEAARQEGPQAVVDIGATLRGEARDLAMADIQEAHERLAAAAPPRPETTPPSPAEEEAAVQAQQALEADSREQALNRGDDPAENQYTSVPSVQAPEAPTIPAADLTVGNGCSYATITEAIGAANPGDRLLIEGGRTFNELITIPKNLTLQGGYSGCDSASSARTVLDGGGGDSVVTVDSGVTASLLNMDITGGSTAFEGGGIQFAVGSGTGQLTLTNVDVYNNTGQWGGGIWVGPDADLLGTNVNIHDNTASTFGGGLRLYGSRASFSNSNIYANTAPQGAGVYASLQNGVAPSLDLPTYADLYDNQALTGNGFGGGLYLQEGTVSLADCSDIYSNDAVDGAGSYLITSTLTIDGSCSEIENNQATGNGGGVYAVDSSINLDDQAELYNNDAGTDGTGSGGGAYLDNSNLYSDRASIRWNAAADFGGGVYATNSSIVDMDLGSYICLGVRCSRLASNTASNMYGGGIYANTSTVYLDNTFVESNSADLGGGIYISNGPLYAYNNLFARNNATGTVGDGIRLFSSAYMSGSNNTLAYNDAGGAATGRAIDLFSSTLNLSCSIAWGHTTSISPSGLNVTYSDIQGGYAGTGNLDTNPLFVNASAQDYHLQTSSPVIDRCISGGGSGYDFENEKRPIVRTTAASPYDMGADEVSGEARVGINGACAYGTIQQAVNAAQNGDTLQIAAGVYFENVDIANKSITLQGGYDSACTTAGTAATRIEGTLATGSTLDILGGTVNLRDLRISWGSTTGGGLDLIDNATVVLDNTDVVNNHGTYGGGVYVSANSNLDSTNGSLISDNTASTAGGGVRLWGAFSGYGTTSDISGNCAPDGGGFSVPGGTLYLDNADVVANQAAGATGKGGGIHVTSGGEITLENSVFVGETVPCCQSAYEGGGIYADNAIVNLVGNTTTVMNNTAANNGGGIYLTNGSLLTSTGASIGHTTYSVGGNDALSGAGIYATNSSLDFAGSVYNNIASVSGAGIYADTSTLSLHEANIGGSGTNQPNQLGPSGWFGAGMYLTNASQITIDQAVISSNTFQGTTSTYGGGMYISAGGVVTATNSRIEQHTAPSVSDGRGAGVYLYNGTLTLDNTQVLSNTAGTVGGGVRMFGTSTLNLLNGTSLVNNEAQNGGGGAIAATNAPDINITNTTLQYNTSAGNGGAIDLDAGTLDFNGWWDLRFNHASGNGGAISLSGSADADFSASGGTSYLAVNSASGNGGGLYVANNDTIQLYATSGYLLNFNTNTAGGNGGGAYANNGAYFDIFGQLLATSNIAGGNGGAFYLEGGSRLWLDDYSDTRPQVLVNTAAGNGGAIYAVDSPRIDCDGADFGFSNNGNRATTGSGGALYLSSSIFTADNCVMRNNRAAQNGGAIAAYNSTLTIDTDYPTAAAVSAPEANHLSPEAPTATFCNPLIQQCSSLYSNTADSDVNNTGHGGAIYASGSNLTIKNTYLHRNSGVRGGAIFQEGVGATAQIENSLVYSNTSTASYGAGIRTQSGIFTLMHTTLANNINGAGYSHSGTTSNIYNSIAWGNDLGGFWSAPFAVAECNIDQSGNAGSNLDPGFVSAGAGEDYHLQHTSPAIDACLSGSTTDLENVPRPFGSGYDMGAFEYANAFSFTPDHSDSGLPGSSVTYVHDLANNGAKVDSYTFLVNSDLGWGVTLDPPGPIDLYPGESVPVNLTVNIPSGVISNTLETTSLEAVSSNDPTLKAAVVDETKAGYIPGLSFSPDHTTIGAVPGETYQYDHQLVNTGNYTDTAVLNLDSSTGWGSLATPGPFLLGPGEAATVEVLLVIPAGAVDQMDITTVTAHLQGSASSQAQVVDQTTTIPERFIYLPTILKD